MPTDDAPLCREATGNTSGLDQAADAWSGQRFVPLRTQCGLAAPVRILTAFVQGRQQHG
ncbi:hypothetical protein [Micromonospora thermarum]|uniref:Uncharacterized protein n=1 Tax=Micromonospora thermarum TaxID=2720024 RepID=A0ABX0Z4Z2_9ACTN|nr:hypothetical protein [Micromonospora thermarum]NJP32867.1 hypothetical protein [Micromonospora thermarum]